MKTLQKYIALTCAAAAVIIAPATSFAGEGAWTYKIYKSTPRTKQVVIETSGTATYKTREEAKAKAKEVVDRHIKLYPLSTNTMISYSLE